MNVSEQVIIFMLPTKGTWINDVSMDEVDKYESNLLNWIRKIIREFLVISPEKSIDRRIETHLKSLLDEFSTEEASTQEMDNMVMAVIPRMKLNK